MSEIYGLPQALTGAETVTIHQEQNGQLARCSMPLSQLAFLFTAWMAALPKDEPATAGIPWNNAGVISVS